jgi:integrase/recombinase XerD
MSAAEAARLVAAARKLGDQPYRVCRLLLATGLRAAEAATLEVRHLRLRDDPPRLLVIGGKKRDAGTADDVLLAPDFAQELRAWTAKRGERGRVLGVAGDPPPTRQDIWRAVKRAVRLARLNSRYSPHTLRHRFATDVAVAAGGDMAWVRRQTRHQSLDQVTRYVHAADSEMKAGERLASMDRVQRRGGTR